MMKNKRTLRADEKQHPSKRVIRPRPLRLGLDGTCVVRFGSPSKSGRGAWSELSEQVASRLSKSVVSLASFVGHTMLLERTGICIESLCANATSFLTSASLVLPTQGERKISDNLTIKVRLPNDRIVIGWLENYDISFDFAVVNIKHVRGFHAAHLSLNHAMQFEPYRKVVAVWRCFNSGLLMATSGVVLGTPSAKPSDIMLSTCQINTAGIGGPLVDFDGNFVGMNYYRSKRKMTPYIQRDIILQCLRTDGIVRFGIRRERSTSKIQKSYILVGMRVINSFEDVFDGDIWSKLCKCVASKISRSVVSLASFNGDARFFACTGVFIDCSACSARILTSASLVRISGDVHEINDNLRIEVCLRNEFRVIGILKHYNLHYNIALVDIMGYWSPLTVELRQHMPVTPDMDVIAVGCLFYERKLMATKGVVLIGESKLDCKELCVSTCKITKAGIGGPLIDTDGNFVGMNFYHEKETPFLPRDVIQGLLWDFNARWPNAADTIDERDENRYSFSPQKKGNRYSFSPQKKGNRWPVPEPFWRPRLEFRPEFEDSDGNE